MAELRNRPYNYMGILDMISFRCIAYLSHIWLSGYWGLFSGFSGLGGAYYGLLAPILADLMMTPFVWSP